MVDTFQSTRVQRAYLGTPEIPIRQVMQKYHNRCQLLDYLPLNTGLRFCKKAAIPSLRSSVVEHIEPHSLS